MKIWVFVSLWSLVYFPTMAQDKIVMHNGEIIEGKVNFLTTSEVHYRSNTTLKAETIPKPLVEKIIYKKGIVEGISTKVDVQGAKDWEKVQLTDNPLKVKGLTPKGEIGIRSIGDIKLSGVNGYENKELQRVKKLAAKQEGHLIFLTKENKLDAGRSKHKMEKAIIYGY
ncbi:hypothetical protein CLV98_104151 [Dyadobacter jejuensis]|uniref:Uncharacterized protein n=1 Tax=Dyadobacter jejuensis TaxID=1082580 RepID=A0A316AKJ6_9BACT|nr:hypothetical protein [Dyadobacter jejuensis]PWJ58293.1 hypothetical protein CLV98_104151 [Dyadobacter jejuensis]